jgi:putative nucleotidyltransferase with HDIG domain
MDNLIGFLDNLIGIREAHGNSHGRQVNVLSSALARQVDFSASDLADLEFAATVHDIGKLTVNEFIINKAGRLTEAEYIMIKQHTVLGHKLVEPLSLPKLVTDVILSHHENYDGSGYPHGLAGEQIPLAARIIRIADTYDALTSNRGYHTASSHTQALDIMAKVSEYFDPKLLEIFMKMNIKRTPANVRTTARH